MSEDAPRFTGRNRRAQARQFVRRVCAAMLDAEISGDWEKRREGWMFGGEHDDDVGLIREEVRRLRDRMARSF